MDAETITQLINGVGFPIVASGALFWLNVNVMRQQKETLAALQKSLAEHTEALNRLTEKVKTDV